MASFRKSARRVSTLVERDVRRLGESRGFAESRLLTHWAEIVGPDIAAICRPVQVSFPRSGFGAVLKVLTTGAQAPMLEMQLPRIIEKVNACYGYRAISRITLTQTAPTGFAEGQVSFETNPNRAAQPPETPEIVRTEARKTAAGVGDPALRDSLERLAANIISRRRADTARQGGKT
ncbi:Zn-ribbon-containing, possibly RNA-binding protein and truncated derivatives [Jannaschia seosinensis]|uniref:Zn-ribbon-containing, possibly RNA-binding protein and truncated derivatives n=1 Tax=Jannaschia seosinensis TaxID=313367 RepID=A0A0M7B9C8_9RHOB|nr:DUF721 domain-containing protein [Jannaschia seosinensis]CUH38981.1 Zn-ribbon-containing, possibly RNA-binding protein and truncated derivatives [Jannaschia seosinensis]